MVSSGSPSMHENECLWNGCHLLFPTAEELYDHITGYHVGRKSAGTLSLECMWENCSSRASKRDHLTSHIRVHVNLKPHDCKVCGKAFKRPQDLKKHEKIHTEEHHASHRQSKAAVPKTSSPKSNQSRSSEEPARNNAHHGHQAQMPQMPFAFGLPNFGYPFVGQPMYNGMAMQPSQLDLAAMIAQQQHLNAQIAAGAGAGWFAGNGLSAPGFFNPIQAQAMPGFSMPPAFPVSAPLGMTSMTRDHGMQGASLYPQLGNLHHGMPAAHAQQQPQQQGLYPSLAHHGQLSPAHKPEDTPSPASSAHSHNSDFSHRSSSHTSVHSSHSASPRVPSLASPASSSSRDEGSDISARHAAAAPVLAGTKRGFSDAAGEFVSDFKNKRFQDWDTIGQQLDHLSNFLVTPDEIHPDHQENDYGSAALSADSPASDLSRPEIDSINELLLSLGQSLEEPARMAPPASHHSHSTSAPARDVKSEESHGHSLYPSLAGESRQFASLPSRAVYGQPQGHDAVRMSKTTTPATLAANDYRSPHYRNIERLTRAPPVSNARGGVDDEDIRYNTSLRSTSSKSADSSPAQELARLPAITKTLPRLAPIDTSPASTSGQPGSLPSIRDLLAAIQQTESPVSATASEADSVTSSDSLNTARPSTAGAVETLSRGLTRIDVVGERSESHLEHEHSDCEDDENHPSKKTRRSPPAATSLSPEERAKLQKRLAVVQALVLHFNEQYRSQLARKMGFGANEPAHKLGAGRSYVPSQLGPRRVSESSAHTWSSSTSSADSTSNASTPRAE